MPPAYIWPARLAAPWARGLGHPELGTLTVGAAADLAVFALDEGAFPLVDCGQATLTGSCRPRCVLTLRAGEVVYNPHGLGLPDWAEAPPEYWTLRRVTGSEFARQ